MRCADLPVSLVHPANGSPESSAWAGRLWTGIMAVLLTACSAATLQGQALPVAELDRANPWYPDRDYPALRTPQWVGDDGVEAVVVLAIDDMRDPAKYEQYLRPILNRLKEIDGRAPVSIMTCDVKPDDPQLQSWLEEGLSLECHTVDHPCPLLNAGDLAKAKSTYDRCVDLLHQIPGNRPVAFRTPCCDSLNTVSPRFYASIFNGTTEHGHFLQLDSSVFNFFTAADPDIPRELILDESGHDRFAKYRPKNLKRGDVVHNNFVNVITNYPYPYVINNTCWQFPCVAPSDWSAQHLHGVNNPKTVADWKAALDITMHKQGVFCLVFHPHGWISSEQVVELIDHCVAQHGSKVKFLSFRECADRLNRSLTQGTTLREAPAELHDALSHREYRHAHPAPTDLASLPEDVQRLLTRDVLQTTSTAADGPGSHPGVFVNGGDLCWQNEDTAALPDLVRRIPIATLVARQRRLTQQHRPVAIGAARIDITPKVPVLLTGYAGRTQEATEVAAPIHARALVIGGAETETSTRGSDSATARLPLTVLVTVDNCGVPASVTEAVFDRLSAEYGLARERFAVSSTHTHSGPWLRDFAPLILTGVLPEQAQHLKQYEAQLTEQLTQVVAQAIAGRRPGTLSIGHGKVGFAKNRRNVQSGQWVGFGEADEGPVDRRLSILAAHGTDGNLIAILTNYACHATTETGEQNQISGDWPGCAAAEMESDFPGAVALVAIGCGADANPSPRGSRELSLVHGRAFADEVKRLLNTRAVPATETSTGLLPLNPEIVCQLARIDLPHSPLPTREEWEQRAQQGGQVAAHARHFLAMLDEGQSIPTVVEHYPVQTWCFGDDLAMVFLAGEVVVDYDIRMNDMFEGERLWINAYCNDVPCYIASKRILREGGYEADSSMLYYGRPTRLAPEAEDLICDAVQKQLPHQYYSESLRVDFPAPVSPEQTLSTFTARPGLRVELVASEPLIADPVAFDWDVNGRLWVVEMGDYPSGTRADDATDSPSRDDVSGLRAESPTDFRRLLAASGSGDDAPGGGGRIRVLQDTNGDGRCDTATTFLDGLPFPTGLSHWRGGLLITSAPYVLYAEDNNHDLQADAVRILYAGFGEGNQQHRVNGLRWGLDGWLYLGNGDSGGEIRAVGSVLADLAPSGDAVADAGRPRNAVSVRNRDIRIQPDGGQIDTVAGQTQYGRERDDFGNWFGNNNSNPIWHYVLEESYARRNPHYAGATLRREIAEVPGAAPVFPASRTLARFNDFYAANRFTSACSTAILRDSLPGSEFYGNAFTCEPVHNLVSRLVLDPDGASFRAHRAADEQESEFLASSDNWFRPTMVRTGPDGGLYVSDMYRFVIEHPTWIPEEYQRKLNVRAGDDRGRIYRLLPDNGCCATTARPSHAAAAAAPAEPAPELREFFDVPESDIPVSDLVGRLLSPNGWWRDTAQRILLHRNDPSAVDLLFDFLARDSSPPAAQVQMLWTLQLLITSSGEPAAQDRLKQELTLALGSPDPRVRRQAVRLLEPWVDDPEIVRDNSLARLLADPDQGVVLQLAWTLGESSSPSSSGLLAALLSRHADDALITSAAISSLNETNIEAVLHGVAGAESEHRIDDVLFGELTGQAAAMGQVQAVAAPLAAILRSLAAADPEADPAQWRAALLAVRQIRRFAPVETSLRSDRDIQSLWNAAVQRAFDIAVEGANGPELRTAAIEFAAAGRQVDASHATLLTELLSPQTPHQVQLAAVSALTDAAEDTVLQQLLSRWGGMSPGVRAAVMEALLRRSDRIRLLLQAVSDQQVATRDVDAVFRDRLLGHRDEDIRRQAADLFQIDQSSTRAEIVAAAAESIEGLTPDGVHGKTVFEKRCGACHRLQDTGKSIGADLAALKDRSDTALLVAILDPNRAAESKFLTYTAVTHDGLTHAGMLLSESSNSVTLIGTDGVERVILRDELAELISSDKSLMPEGLEKDLNPQDLADVMEFVQSSGVSWKRFDGNMPAVIRAEPDGTLVLPATAAEIYGPNLIFEARYQNIGWWNSADDYAVWNVDVPVSGHWTVEFDYACDNGTAGNLLRLSTGTRMLTARVPGTGTWDDYRMWTAGTIDLHRGVHQLTITAPEQPSSALIDLRTIRLIPPQ